MAQGPSIQKCLPVAIASCATSKIEKRYSQLDLEGLAVYFGLQQFQQYIIGGPAITIVTDRKPLASIFHNKRLGSLRLDQIKLRHQDVKYNLIWQKGAINPANYISRHAVPLSQLPKHIQKETEEYDKLCWFLHSSPYLESISHETIKEHTQHDKVLQCLKQCIINQQQPSMHHELHPFQKIFPEITISDGGLLM